MERGAASPTAHSPETPRGMHHPQEHVHQERAVSTAALSPAQGNSPRPPLLSSTNGPSWRWSLGRTEARQEGAGLWAEGRSGSRDRGEDMIDNVLKSTLETDGGTALNMLETSYSAFCPGHLMLVALEGTQGVHSLYRRAKPRPERHVLSEWPGSM